MMNRRTLLQTLGASALTIPAMHSQSTNSPDVEEVIRVFVPRWNARALSIDDLPVLRHAYIELATHVLRSGLEQYSFESKFSITTEMLNVVHTQLTERGAVLAMDDIHKWFETPAPIEEIQDVGIASAILQYASLFGIAAIPNDRRVHHFTSAANCGIWAKAQAVNATGAAILGGAGLLGCVPCGLVAAGMAIGIGIGALYGNFVLKCAQ